MLTCILAVMWYSKDGDEWDGSRSRRLRLAYRIGRACARDTVDEEKIGLWSNVRWNARMARSELADQREDASAEHDMVGQSSQARGTIKIIRHSDGADCG